MFRLYCIIPHHRCKLIIIMIGVARNTYINNINNNHNNDVDERCFFLVVETRMGTTTIHTLSSELKNRIQKNNASLVLLNFFIYVDLSTYRFPCFSSIILGTIYLSLNII